MQNILDFSDSILIPTPNIRLPQCEKINTAASFDVSRWCRKNLIFLSFYTYEQKLLNLEVSNKKFCSPETNVWGGSGENSLRHLRHPLSISNGIALSGRWRVFYSFNFCGGNALSQVAILQLGITSGFSRLWFSSLFFPSSPSSPPQDFKWNSP